MTALEAFFRSNTCLTMQNNSKNLSSGSQSTTKAIEIATDNARIHVICNSIPPAFRKPLYGTRSTNSLLLVDSFHLSPLQQRRHKAQRDLALRVRSYDAVNVLATQNGNHVTRRWSGDGPYTDQKVARAMAMNGGNNDYVQGQQRRASASMNTYLLPPDRPQRQNSLEREQLTAVLALPPGYPQRRESLDPEQMSTANDEHNECRQQQHEQDEEEEETCKQKSSYDRNSADVTIIIPYKAKLNGQSPSPSRIRKNQSKTFVAPVYHPSFDGQPNKKKNDSCGPLVCPQRHFSRKEAHLYLSCSSPSLSSHDSEKRWTQTQRQAL